MNDELMAKINEGMNKYLNMIDTSSIPQELRTDIGILRQLLNEEYIGKDRLISSEEVYSLTDRLRESAFLLGYKAGEAMANGTAETVSWKDAKERLKKWKEGES